MTKAIERIVAGYVTLKNRAALEEIRTIVSVCCTKISCAVPAAFIWKA